MFSKKFTTYQAWRTAQQLATPYVRKIERMHAFHPKATLSQLRRHPKGSAKPLSMLARRPDMLVSPKLLSAKERTLQHEAIAVKRLMLREKLSFSVAVQRLGVNRSAMRRRLAPYMRSRGGKLFAVENDRLPRSMILYDEHGAYSVVVRAQREASKIGRYHAALKHWENDLTRDPRTLKKFDRMVVVDENGVRHRFLTDPIALTRLFRAREVRYESIYHYVR